VFQTLQASGSLPLSTLEYADPAATWQVFRERRATLAATSAQWYLAENARIDSAGVTLLPTHGQDRLALADGWSWAIVNPGSARHAQAAELIGWLTLPQYNAAWTEAAQVLPTRAASLAGWQSDRLAAAVGDVLTHARLQPSATVLAVVGPALQQALADVLNGRATPFTAASAAAAEVAPP